MVFLALALAYLKNDFLTCTYMLPGQIRQAANAYGDIGNTPRSGY